MGFDPVFLDPKRVRFFKERGRLCAEIDGRVYRGVTPARLFPLSEPDGWISVLDEEGEEIGILKSLKGMDDGSRRLLVEELRKRYIMPVVKRFLSCRERFEVVEWEVETDRGVKKFLLRNPEENVKRPYPISLILVDVDGNRYYVPDIRKLDRKSLELIERYL
ncbi:hypothetical protein DRP77_12210 [Candidatus Poribacteria bacterium]|nr:MAG: hypothetical protein DRP77_12210 [Candidatus Poribacteria bacterium]